MDALTTHTCVPTDMLYLRFWLYRLSKSILKGWLVNQELTLIVVRFQLGSYWVVTIGIKA